MAVRYLAVVYIFLHLAGGCTSSVLFAGPLSPGSAGLFPYIPIPTKHTVTLLITITIILYTAVNLFRRFYLERYERDEDGRLYPVECKPTTSLVDGLFSLSAKWGIVKPPLSKCSQQHLFAGWAHAFVQCGRFWRKLGDGMVTISHYPEADKYKIVMKNACDVVLINHELTKNMALFRDENQGIHISRWSAIDFASMQPRSETFCLRWNHMGSAESFNQTFYKCTQPASYTDSDIYPLNAVPAACKQMDLTTQWPTAVNNYAQTAPPPVITSEMTGRPSCPPITCSRRQDEPLYDIFTERDHGGSRGTKHSSGGASSHSKVKRQPSRKISRSASRKGPAITRSASRISRQPSRVPSRKSGMIRPSRSRIRSQKSLSRQSSRMVPRKSASRMSRRSSIGGRRSSIAGRRSSIAGRRSSIAGRRPSMSRHSVSSRRSNMSRHSRIGASRSRASRRSVFRY